MSCAPLDATGPDAAGTKRPPLSVAIARHLLPWRRLDWPLDWDAVFGRSAERVLEIGFGNGEFLAHACRERRDRDHVGLELSWSGAFRLLKRLGAEDANVRALLVDAEVALERLIAPESLAEVIVNHPCPWPKDRHHERRLLQPAMLRLLADRMAPGAKLTVVTDHAEYAAWVGEQLASQRELESLHATSEVAAIPGRLTTKYERKAMAEGIPIHYFEWQRVRRPVDVPQPQALPAAPEPMPSVKLSGVPNEPVDPFAAFEHHLWRESCDGVEVVVRFSGAFRRVGERDTTWLVETLVQEGGLRQDFGIVAVRRSGDELLLKLSDLGHPHPTHGVRRALFALAEWIRERHPGVAIRHENLGPRAMEPVRPAESGTGD